MTERSMTEEAMRASLQDIRLPAEAAGGTLADIATAIGLAALLALVVLAALRLFGLRRRTGRAPSLSDRIASIMALPEDPRRIALLHLLKDRDPQRYAALAGQGLLYRPEGIPLAAIEDEVRRLA